MKMKKKKQKVLNLEEIVERMQELIDMEIEGIIVRKAIMLVDALTHQIFTCEIYDDEEVCVMPIYIDFTNTLRKYNKGDIPAMEGITSQVLSTILKEFDVWN